MTPDTPYFDLSAEGMFGKTMVSEKRHEVTAAEPEWTEDEDDMLSSVSHNVLVYQRYKELMN